jgi:hypothetical protein
VLVLSNPDWWLSHRTELSEALVRAAEIQDDPAHAPRVTITERAEFRDGVPDEAEHVVAVVRPRHFIGHEAELVDGIQRAREPDHSQELDDLTRGRAPDRGTDRGHGR